MKKGLVRFVVLMVMVTLIGSGQVLAQEAYPQAEAKLSDKVYIEVVPRMELLAGVLSQTSWMERRGPLGKGNEYFQALQEFFAPYKDHEAVQIAQKLTERGFVYDAPPAFILRLGPLPDLEKENGYGFYLTKRAMGQGILEDFRKALIDLAEVSNFQEFYQEQHSLLNQLVQGISGDLESEKILAWMEDFYGWTGSEFHMVLAPSMFPGGGYGSSLTKQNGEEVIFYVMREDGRGDGEIQFSNTGTRMTSLALHEWGHSFVNPSLGEHPFLIRRLHPLYDKVAGRMERQAYGSVQTFMNEQVLRAVTTLAMRDLYGEMPYKSELEDHRRRGFYLTEYTIEQLEYYQAHRDEYPRFDDFTDDLLKNYYRDYDLEQSNLNKALWIGGAAVLAGLLVGLLL